MSYNKQRLHKVGYFRELLASNPDIDEGLRSMLRLCRETVVRLQKTRVPWCARWKVLRCWWIVWNG